MKGNDFSEFRILDILQMKRSMKRIKTVHKSCFVISCRVSGESVFFYNDKQYTVKQGDILYIPNGASYYQECREEELIAFHLNIYGNAPKDIRICTPENSEEICELFRNASRTWQTKAAGYAYYCMSDLYKILAMTGIADNSDHDTSPNIIAEAMNYLHAHLYDTTLSLNDVYRQSTLSPTSFIKYFRKIYGCTPIKYINQMRIQKAKMLLKSNIYTREEIAFLCGFENVKHFYVVFKQLTGCTTGDFLKNNEGELIDMASAIKSL